MKRIIILYSYFGVCLVFYYFIKMTTYFFMYFFSHGCSASRGWYRINCSQFVFLVWHLWLEKSFQFFIWLIQFYSVLLHMICLLFHAIVYPLSLLSYLTKCLLCLLLSMSIICCNCSVRKCSIASMLFHNIRHIIYFRRRPVLCYLSR